MFYLYIRLFICVDVNWCKTGSICAMYSCIKLYMYGAGNGCIILLYGSYNMNTVDCHHPHKYTGAYICC